MILRLHCHVSILKEYRWSLFFATVKILQYSLKYIAVGYTSSQITCLGNCGLSSSRWSNQNWNQTSWSLSSSSYTHTHTHKHSHTVHTNTGEVHRITGKFNSDGKSKWSMYGNIIKLLHTSFCFVETFFFRISNVTKQEVKQEDSSLKSKLWSLRF